MSQFNHRHFLGNRDHNFSSFKNQTITKDELIHFLDCNIEDTAVINFSVNANGLLIITDEITLTKEKFLIVAKDNGGNIVDEALDHLTLAAGSYKEINFGGLIDNSFKYTQNEAIWSNGLETGEKIKNGERSQDVYYNQNKGEGRAALAYYSLKDTYKAISNSQPYEIWQAAHATIHNDWQGKSPYFITTESIDHVNRVYGDDGRNKDINLIKLTELDQAVSGKQGSGSCILNEKRYPIPAGGQIIRVSHIPAADLKIPDIVQNACQGEYKNYTINEIVELGKNIPLPARCKGDDLDQTGKGKYSNSPDVFQMYADATGLYSTTHLSTTSGRILLGCERDDKILKGDTFLGHDVGVYYARSNTDTQTIFTGLEQHKDDLCCNRAEINLLSLAIQDQNNSSVQVDIASSVFPLYYSVYDYKVSGEKTDNDAVLRIKPISVGIFGYTDKELVSRTVNGQWSIKLTNGIFDTPPKFNTQSIPFAYDGRIFKPDAEKDYGYADYSYAIMENCIWGDQNLLSPETSSFVKNTDPLTSTTNNGDVINTYLDYGCGDLLSHSISKLSCELAAKLTMTKPEDSLNIKYTRTDKHGSDSPLMYYKNSAKEIKCLYLPETTPTISKFSISIFEEYTSMEGTSYIPVRKMYRESSRVRDFDNGNVAAVAAFVHPDTNTLGFNSKTTYGYFGISDRVKITATPTSSGISGFIENYTLQTYSYSLSSTQEVHPLSYAKETSQRPLIFNNTRLTPNSQGKTVGTFSEETGWISY